MENIAKQTQPKTGHYQYSNVKSNEQCPVAMPT